jgi:predicted phosphodiesterase
MNITDHSILKALDVWTEVNGLLTAGNSLVLYAPRNYGKRHLASAIMKGFEQDSLRTSVVIHSEDFTSSNSVDYARLWDATANQTNLRTRTVVKDSNTYLAALKGALKKVPAHLLFVVTSAGAGTESHHFDVVSALQVVREELPVPLRCQIQLLVLDDYSLYYHITSRIKFSSPRWDLQAVHQRPFGHSELLQLLTRVLNKDTLSDGVDEAARSLLSLTGGHVGLTLEAIEHTRLKKVSLNSEHFSAEAGIFLERSAILETLRKALSQDPRGLTEVALKYKNGRVWADYDNPNVQFLRQIGVIQGTSCCRAELCPGIIHDLVVGVNEASSDTRPLGTLVSELGPRVYDGTAENLVASDKDFVVVHLSDLHVGPKYGYRLPAKVSGRSEDIRRSAAQLLQSDLRTLGLEDRIDLLVISGDFTDKAGMDEFNRARELVAETLASVGLDCNRLIITAGNHDVQWNPPALAQTQMRSGVSRENFEIFSELLGCKRKGAPECTAILSSTLSRDGMRELRMITVDSNYVEGPDAAGVGFVSLDTLSCAERLICDHKTPEGCGYSCTWIVVHHHVFPVSSPTIADNEKRPKLTVLANAPDVLAFANRIGAEVILHGHQHQPSVTVARRWPSSPSQEFSPIISVGAGSFTAERAALGPFSRNQYFILYRRSDNIVIRSRSISDNGLAFVAHNDLVVPLGNVNSPF